MNTTEAARAAGLLSRFQDWARKKDTSFLYYLAARLIPAVLAFVTLRYVIAFVSRAEFGEWGYLGTISGMLIPVLSLSLPQAMMRLHFDHRDDDRDAQRSLATTTLLLNFAAAGVVAVVAAVLFLFGVYGSVYLAYFGGVTSGAVLVNYFGYLTRVYNDYRLFFFNKLFESACFLLLVVLSATRFVETRWAAGDRLLWLAVFLGITLWSIVILNAVYYVRRHVLSSRSGLLGGDAMRDMLRFSLPLIGTFFVGWVLSSSGVYFLRRLANLTDTADYVFAMSVAGVVGLITQASLLDWPRFYYAQMRDGGPARDELISRRARLFLWLHVAAIVVVRLVAGFAYDLLGADNYTAGLEYLSYLLLGNFFFLAGNLLAAGIGYAKRTGLMLLTFIVPGALSVGLNLWLVPLWGGRAAAVTMLLAYLCFAALSWWVGRRFYPFAGFSRILVVAAAATFAALVPIRFG